MSFIIMIFAISIIWLLNDYNHVQPNNNLAWTKADFFAPLTEESMEVLAEAEEYELAAIVRDNLNLQNH